jgi:hypothetical protein
MMAAMVAGNAGAISADEISAVVELAQVRSRICTDECRRFNPSIRGR